MPFDWLRGGIVEDVCGDPRDEITYVHDGAVYIITQESALPQGSRVYAPERRLDISVPGWAE